MELISTNISNVKTVEWKKKLIKTGIFKEPITGKLKVEGKNIQGDNQADLTVHGGYYKALYGYPHEHYDYWKTIYPNLKMGFGWFGENLTTKGLFENSIHVGDRIRIGTAELIITGPRMPCYKLGIKFGTQAIINQFHLAGLSGFYFSIAKNGILESGDRIEIIEKDKYKITINDILRVYKKELDIQKNEEDLKLSKVILKLKYANPNLKQSVENMLDRYQLSDN